MSTMPTEKSFVKGDAFPPMKEGTLRLYSMRFCPYAQRTRLLLAHKQIPYETVNVDLRDKPEWFLERNPGGMVPTLEEDGKVVYESAICNDYIEDVYPQNKTKSADPYRRARDRILTERFNKVIGPHYKMLRSRGEEEEVKTDYKNQLDVFEKELGSRGNYFGGNTVSNLDYLLWPYFERWVALEELCNFTPSPDRYPNLLAWVGRMYQLPAVKACMFGKTEHVHFYKSAASSGKPDYDYGL